MNWEKYYIDQASSSFETPFPYSGHYTSQIGGGVFYAGIRKQQGYGLGGILSKLGRFVLPLVKPVARSIGKQVLKSGARFAGEILSGEDPKESFKRNLKQGALDLLTKKRRNNRKRKIGSKKRGIPKIKRRINKRSSGPKVPRSNPRDIFDI